MPAVSQPFASSPALGVDQQLTGHQIHRQVSRVGLAQSAEGGQGVCMAPGLSVLHRERITCERVGAAARHHLFQHLQPLVHDPEVVGRSLPGVKVASRGRASHFYRVVTELVPGARLAHFVVSRRLGAGGMGVVYEALDETLGRKVAVKVLTPELVGSAERRRRFLREARSAAAMSHPNIATVYEIDEADGQVFIVMELVPGESLRDAMAPGRLPISRALDIAHGMAEAAEHAHAAGVVHRDLKPENVMVLSEDRVKVLDFGIAKPDDDLGTANTLPANAPITEEGRVIGTPGYMAPEQARGAAVDARTDVFAIGVVLYEMVTGTRPFVGSSSLDVMVATSRDDPPPVSSHNPGAPPIVETIVRRCLAKGPRGPLSERG
jgi:serine/threonine protein kinase